MDRIRVGVIGVTPGRSWGAIAHIPALRALPEFEVVGLANTSAESARAAARALGIQHAFASPRELIEHSDVDLVAVTVKVPYHRELVAQALVARKAVYCEWPLGNGLAEAIEMAAHAKRSGLLSVVGLQARMAPAIEYVKDLIQEGYIGEVLSTTLVGSGSSWGDTIDRANAYTADKANGATLLTIPFGHTVDALCHCLGEFQELSATVALRRTRFMVAETGESVSMTAEDQVAVTGTLANGAVASVHYRGGVSRGTNLLWEINGTAGDLQIRAQAGHAQLAELTLLAGCGGERELSELPVPQKYRIVPRTVQGPAVNVGKMYARLAEDWRSGTQRCPNFQTALARHRMLADVERASETGKKVVL